MATTNRNRPIIHQQVWEMVHPPLPSATAAGRFVSSSRLPRQTQYYLESATVAYEYLPGYGWILIPSPALGGTFAAGACGVCSPLGPSGTATAGTTTTITTNLTIARDLVDFKIRITGGPGADGTDRTITYNTVGANSVITFTPALPVAATAATTYQLLTGTWYVFNAHTAAPVANQLKKYDRALNTWTAIANLPAVGAAWGTDGRMIGTPSMVDGAYSTFASGTATAGGASTLTNAAKTWTVNQFNNAFQVRITGGTGAGQFRTIASNTATVLTTTSAWTTVPDATSTYVIEGSDQYLYLMGNNAVTLYRLDTYAGTWTTLAPAVARAAAPGLGFSGHWIWGVADPIWNTESANLNGRRFLSFRGAAGAVLDQFDIPANTWTSGLTYAPAAETFTTGTKWTILDGRYIICQKDATGRWLKFDPLKNEMVGLTAMLYTQGAAVVGDTCWDVTFTDGATEIQYLYMALNTSQVVMRCMLI